MSYAFDDHLTGAASKTVPVWVDSLLAKGPT
jgi:hypothetical protein